MTSQFVSKIVRYCVGVGIVLTAGCQSMSQVTIRVKPSGDVEVQLVPKENRDVCRSDNAASRAGGSVRFWSHVFGREAQPGCEQDDVFSGVPAQVHQR